jgi:acyl carrier protein
MQAFLVDKIQELAFESVKSNDSLWKSGILDSITIVEFAVEIEQKYGIEIPFDEIIEDNFETLEKLMAYITRRLDSK